MNDKKLVFSGVQPTGNLHLGNYLGALKNFGFIIIPIATSISTWIGVLIYIYWLNKKKSLLLNIELVPNFFKILTSSIIMSLTLIFALKHYAIYLNYSYNYKAIYLISIVGFAGSVYLLSCYLLGILKIKNYKTN